MSKSVILSIISIFASLLLKAQDTIPNKKSYKYNNNFDLALSSSGGQSMGAISWTHFHAVTKKERFKIGYGIRFNTQFGKDVYYTTAPAILTSKQTGPQVLFSETFPENIDTFFVSNSQNNSVNVSINLQYTIKQKFDIGFSIDALGLTFGGSTSGKYIAYQAATLNGSMQKATPTSFNLLLVSDNDIGMLNSELYFRYWLKSNFAVKVGASFVFTEYTTDNKLRLDNNRWRNKALMGMIGVTYTPFN
jgi:hypothetical protein